MNYYVSVYTQLGFYKLCSFFCDYAIPAMLVFTAIMLLIMLECLNGNDKINKPHASCLSSCHHTYIIRMQHKVSPRVSPHGY